MSPFISQYLEYLAYPCNLMIDLDLELDLDLDCNLEATATLYRILRSEHR